MKGTPPWLTTMSPSASPTIPLTWRESRYFEDFKFTFSTFAEVQAFAKEKLEDQSIPWSGGHQIYVTPVTDDGETGHLMMWKYARWPQLANGD